MRIDRRHSLLGFGATLATIQTFRAERSFSASPEEFKELASLPPVPSRYESIASNSPMNDEFGNATTQLGTSPPSQDEIEVSKAIIGSIGLPSRPVGIAGQLLEIARGAKGAGWSSYTRAWPLEAPANPLILDFFTATKTKPEGDVTAWCAAFLNWCLLKAQFGRPQAAHLKPAPDASSGFFRTWGTEIASFDGPQVRNTGAQPRQGDVVVFKQVSPNGNAHPYKGHVGFFLDMDSSRVKVLGGNQYEGSPVVHAINIKWIPFNGNILKAHSIRTDEALHG